MIPVYPLSGNSAAVFGLGRSGLSAACALRVAGAKVVAWDDDPLRRETARAIGLTLSDYHDIDWAGTSVLVLSPGVPLTHPNPHPIVPIARSAGVKIIGDIELLYRAMKGAKFIGITGTNGKSTTTGLVGHILSLDGQRIEVGGNLGVPALDLQPLASDGTFVIEVSSYQLELKDTLTFDIAALINLSPDHLDRHGNFDNYVAAKRRVFERQTSAHTAVVGIDDAPSQEVYRSLVARNDRAVVPVSVGRRIGGGVYVVDGLLYDDLSGAAQTIADLRSIATLPGKHNWQNAAIAYAISRAAGVSQLIASTSLSSFPGLAHRIELIAEIDGIRYINDSKATNASAAGQALACFNNIYWILGGRPKGRGINSLVGNLGSVTQAFLIGEASQSFADALAGKVPVTLSGDLESAISDATDQAKIDRRERPVILLSPACASFDQWPDFEARGEAFRAAVLAIAKPNSGAGQHCVHGHAQTGLEACL